MGKDQLRKDKTCLNCRKVMKKNIARIAIRKIPIRKTLHLFLSPFFKDPTHYENAFWKTICLDKIYSV